MSCIKLVSILTLFVLLLVGCSSTATESVSAPNAGSSEDYAFEEAEHAPAEAQAEPASRAADGQSVPIETYLTKAVEAQTSRVIIYTGNMSLVVKDTQEAIEVITALADEQGGFVANSNVYEAGDVLRGSITIRVPADRYQDVLVDLRELALRVERESSSSQDATEEFTDLQARKTNLEFTEEALQKLLDERQRVGNTSDILAVYRELTTIRGQIEQIEGRMRYLANQSALSTINIELTPDVLYQPIVVAGWAPQGVAREALQALVAALQGLANIAIWLIIFVLPLLVVMLLPVAVVVFVGREWWRRRKARNKGHHQKDAQQSEE